MVGRIMFDAGRFSISGNDAAGIAVLVVSTWMDVEKAIAPVIGAKGLSALYERSLYLNRTAHPWMVTPHDGAALQTALAALQTVLAQQDGAAAAAGGARHLQIFHEVLGSLIGAPLTDSLLRSIWANSTNRPASLDSSR